MCRGMPFHLSMCCRQVRRCILQKRHRDKTFGQVLQRTESSFSNHAYFGSEPIERQEFNQKPISICSSRLKTVRRFHEPVGILRLHILLKVAFALRVSVSLLLYVCLCANVCTGCVRRATSLTIDEKKRRRRFRRKLQSDSLRSRLSSR